MVQTQINIRLSDQLKQSAERYAEAYGFRNIQDLIAEALREKVFAEREFDETVTEKEIGLIDKTITATLRSKRLVGEKELMKALE